MLHDAVIDRGVLGRGEGGAVEAQEIEVAGGLLEGLAAGGHGGGMAALELLDEERRREQEDAAVPVVVAGGEIGLGALAVGLLDEGGDLQGAVRPGDGRARPDVAIAGLRPVGGDAEGDEPLPARGARGAVDRGEEARHRGDGMVGGQDQHQRVRLLRQQQQRRDADRRRRVAAQRLEHDRLRRHAGEAKMLGHDEAMLVIGDHHRRREAGAVGHPQRRLLQQRALAQQRQELLGVERPRQRPQPRPGAARQDHRMDPPRHALACRHVIVSSPAGSRRNRWGAA